MLQKQKLLVLCHTQCVCLSLALGVVSLLCNLLILESDGAAEGWYEHFEHTFFDSAPKNANLFQTDGRKDYMEHPFSAFLYLH